MIFQPTFTLDGMQTGRPSQRRRPPFGARLHDLRERAGMTQAQVAEHLGITPRAYAFWERDPVALKADQLAALAKLFEVSADYLIGRETPRQRRNGPVGRARRAFEMVSELPRSQQQRILDVVEDMITAQRVSKRKKRRDRSSVV